MKTRNALALSLAIYGALCVYTAIVFPRLPERVPSHWDINGRVNGTMSPIEATVFGLGMPLLLLAFLVGGQWLSPKGYEVERFRGVWNYLFTVMIAMFAVIQVIMLQAALHPDWDAGRAIIVTILAFLGLIGNVMSKVRPNFWAGFRTPWTLASEEVWTQTHRLGAKLMVGAGVLGAIAVAVGLPVAPVFFVLLAAMLYPVLHSLIVYKRLQAAGKL
ncbi:MAG: SdpI family protein [Fimbriimonadaceae bacterium]|nr:SdpI family protein [Fimbriimonadaceae bacterium]